MTNSIDTVAALAAAKSKFAITAAYKFVAMAVMLTNCNLFVQQTRLPVDHPLTFTNDVLSSSVAPPGLMGFGGSIVTSNYFFGFGHSHFANFANVNFRKQTREKQIEWSQMTSQIDTNQVSTLALTWLNNLGVDTLTLEQKYPCTITQRFYYNKTGGDRPHPPANTLPHRMGEGRGEDNTPFFTIHDLTSSICLDSSRQWAAGKKWILRCRPPEHFSRFKIGI